MPASAVETIMGKEIKVKHVTITCRKSFKEVKEAVENLIPEMTTASARSAFDAGDKDAALAALEALPPLVLFNIRPRHVGPMLAALNNNTSVVQYEIGQPLTAMRMTQYQPGIGLYFPIRVFLAEDKGNTTFTYDSPTSSVAQFGDDKPLALAKEFEAALERALKKAGGWDE